MGYKVKHSADKELDIAGLNLHLETKVKTSLINDSEVLLFMDLVCGSSKNPLFFPVKR
jgi:hypothetical protein